MNYARALRTVRASKGITQKSLARMLNIDQGYISRIESQKIKPSLELLEKFAEILDIPLHLLLLLSYEKEDIRYKSEILEINQMSNQILKVITEG